MSSASLKSLKVDFRAIVPRGLFGLLTFFGCLVHSTLEAGRIDLAGAVIVAPEQMGTAADKSITVLVEEVQKRTGITLSRAERWPTDGRAVIAVGLAARSAEFAGSYAEELDGIDIPGTESFQLSVKREPRPAVLIIGKDSRGVLYGVGAFLRKMHWASGSVGVQDDLKIVSTPRYSLRGHQLGYRPKTNAYDAWSPEQFDQYIRELALFGANSIELIPPVSDDDRSSRHMKTPPMEMMIRMTESIASYGLDVWIWYPNVGPDYRSAAGVRAELEERDEVLRQLKRVDALLVPGGDPGDLDPEVFFPFMDKMAVVLNKHHPKAKIWVAPQAFHPTREWLASFYAYINQRPSWLGGVAFAPWIKTPIPEMRSIVPADVPLRRYPDITHNVACQYPVRDWDLAFGITLHRECYNPRPVAMKTIHNAFDEYAIGSITYTEGINDDVNKFVWGDQDWDPGRSVVETLRDYCRFFISAEYSDELAQGFLAEERNWEGPLAANGQVDVTLRQWRQLESSLSTFSREQYRFEMGLLRAYYDGYIRRRLIYETELEMRAEDVLRAAKENGALSSVEQAAEILRRAKSEPVAVDYRKRCVALADSLFAKIGSQLTVARHGAQARQRGGFMDGIDEPLNNAAWLTSQFDRVRTLQSEGERLQAIDKIVNRTNPGPGGFYDNMGAPGSERRIVNLISWAEDPGTLSSPRIAYAYEVDRAEGRLAPLAWKNQAAVIYETPLTLRYTGLDPDASYSIRVSYTGRRGKLRLVADGKHPIHALIDTWEPPTQEFQIPRAATVDGKLLLTWTCGPGQPGSHVSEIWLMKDQAK